MNRRQRRFIAFGITGTAFLAVAAVLAWVIHRHDWGVAAILVAPVIVYGLLRLARRLEAWADEPL
ncbi:hypothetical protein [Arhodomonas sp. SL1]|uniref:hypothetical protein n=1 Tax=Arhodomonas sp. SL1 TaxID=3425691 RepID=UPI003F883AD3